MNKVSLVTLWVDPKTHQILQYTFDDIDMDFFPGRSLVRVGDLKATMRMGQAFPKSGCRSSIEMHFGMMLAVGAVDAQLPASSTRTTRKPTSPTRSNDGGWIVAPEPFEGGGLG